MTDLSPAVQAVLYAYGHEIGGVDCIMGSERRGVAAALRAAADQVTPSDADEPRNNLPMAMECQRIRAEILAIAAELEAQ
jgi:hypothetical protein